MNKSTIEFLVFSTFSRLGDLVAVIAIPLFLYDRTGSLAFATSFTIVVTLASIVSAKISQIFLKRLSPLLLIFWFDAIGVILLLLLGFFDSHNFHLPLFLAICGVIGVVLNVPNFAKGYFLQDYFVDRGNLAQVSMIQGRLMSVAFVLAIVLSVFIYERFGFIGVMIFDAVSYFPLLYLCWNMDRRVGTNPSETSSPAHADGRSLIRLIRDATVTRQGRRYLFLNLFSYVLGSFRSHILIVTFIVIFPSVGKFSIALLTGLGVVASLALSSPLQRSYKKWFHNAGPILSMISLLIALVGQASSVYGPYIAIPFLGILLSELVSLSMSAQRVEQEEVLHKIGQANLSYVGSATAAVGSALLLPLLTGAVGSFGFSVTFAFLGLVTLLVWFRCGGLRQ